LGILLLNPYELELITTATTNLNTQIDTELKRQTNEETLKAIQDVNMGRNMSRQFNSVKELMDDLDADS